MAEGVRRETVLCDRCLSLTTAVLALVLFAAMPAWRGYPVPAPESYAITTEAFEAKVEAMIAAHGTGEEDDEGAPVVRPPPGDVYLLARRWQFYPAIEFQAGATYRLHVASADILHGFHAGGIAGGIDLLLNPGGAHVVELAPERPGQIVLQCSEYCGLRHSRMKAWLKVAAPE